MRSPARCSVDLTTEPLGIGTDGEPVYLKDIWPSAKEIAEIVRKAVTREMFRARYGDVFKGDENWQKIEVEGGAHLWLGHAARPMCRTRPISTGMTLTPAPVTDIDGARILGLFLDSITTDHISPAGSIKQRQPGRATI